MLHQRKSPLRRRAKRYRIDLRAVFQQLAKGVEILYAGARLPLRGDSHQLERRVGEDSGNVLILSNLAVAHQTETDRLHQ